MRTRTRTSVLRVGERPARLCVGERPVHVGTTATRLNLGKEAMVEHTYTSMSVCNCNFCCPHTFFAAPPFPQTHQCALATHRMCIHVEDDCKTLTSDRHPPQLAHIHIRLTSASSLRLADQSHLVPIHLSLIGLVCCCDYGERPILRCHCPSLRR